MKLAVAFAKVVVLGVWFWGAASFVMPASVPAPEIGTMVALGLLAVHVAEAVVFSKSLAAEDGGTVGGHAWKLLIFGYVHVMGVRYG